METPMKILSICTSAGLFDKAFLEAGHDIMPGCEIMPHKQRMYFAWCNNHVRCESLKDLVDECEYAAGPRGSGRLRYDGIIGGPPCQSHTKLRAIRTPKFPDLTSEVNRMLAAVDYNWFLFENVAPLAIDGARHVRMNAMNYGQPHQSRARWFTFSPNLTAPEPIYRGNADDLKAYSVVAGRIYGPKRGAWLQGWPDFAKLPFPCVQLQEALADGVPRCLADAWIRSIEQDARAKGAKQ